LVPNTRHSRIQARESKTAERPEGRKQQRRKGLLIGKSGPPKADEAFGP